MPPLTRILRAARYAWRMTNPWSPMIRDGRGRVTPLYRMDRLLREATGAGELSAPVFERIRARLLAQTRAGMGSRPLGLVVGAAVYVGIYFWIRTRRAVPALNIVGWAMLGSAALLLLSAWAYRYRVPRARREAIAAALFGERCCASCAYDLRGTPADASGLVACPECGAAWRLTSPGDSGAAHP